MTKECQWCAHETNSLGRGGHLQQIVPHEIWREILHEPHAGTVGGHLGEEKTLGCLKERFIGQDTSQMSVTGAELVLHMCHIKQHQSGEKHHGKTSRQDIPWRISRADSAGETEANLWPQSTYMEAHLNPTHLPGYIPLLFPEVVQRNCTVLRFSCWRW